MKHSVLVATATALCACMSVQASPPIEFYSVVRNSEGKAVPCKEMRISAEITADPLGNQVLYTESHNTVSDSEGMIRLMVGEGISTDDFDAVEWTAPRFLRISSDFGESNLQTLGIMELAGVPTAMQAKRASALEKRSADGTLWQLSVDNSGNLSWKRMSNSGTENPSDEPAYPVEYIPENLYFIGSFNQWTVAEAVPFTKVSDKEFTIDRYIEHGEIFKFVPTQTWQNERDWSATTCNIGSPNPLQELNNTPAFPASTGYYKIVVNFKTYTMTITPL